MRLVRCVAAFVLVIITSAGLFVIAVTLGSLPRHDGDVRVDGLKAPINVRRDEYAVPYIEAATEADGYFALGFVHAQDRLWQMEFRRRVAQGRLAELIGASGLPVDRFMRLLRLYDLAAASVDAMQPKHRALVAAYTAGVNAQLEARRGLLPPEFWLLWHRPEAWTDADSVVFTKLMALDLAGNWRRELLRAQLARDLPDNLYHQLFPYEPAPDATTLAGLRTAIAGLDLDALADLAGPPQPTGHGSNAWVVDGTRSKSGAPLLANDPHLGFATPGVWYLAGLDTPQLSVVGATLPGLPAFVLGRTDRIAWGMTNTGSDVQDLVIEELMGHPPDATRTADGTAPLKVYTSTIVCRFCPDEEFDARWSVNGPLLSDLIAAARSVAGTDRALALRWSVLTPTDVPLDAGFALPHAHDWTSFNAALEPFTNPQQNVFYADTNGHIGLVAAGAVPIRRSGDGTLPLPGWERASEWLGFIPFAALPRRLDPATGLLANANNALVGDDYPYVLSRRWDAPWRFQRIVELLGEGPQDVASFLQLQTDVRSGVAAALVPLFLEAAPVGADAAAWHARLADWDFMATVGSREATVFAAWYAALPDYLYADELGDHFEHYGRDRPRFVEHVLRNDPSWCDDETTVALEDCALVLARALEAALGVLERELGPEGPDWDWGRQHPAVFAHDLLSHFGPLGPLTELRFAAGGDDTSVAAMSYRARPTPPLFESDHGAGYRQIVGPGSPEESRFVAPTGQVGHPASPHYRDLTTVWRSGETIPMNAPANAASNLRLIPR